MTVRQIHPFGPAVGEYQPAAKGADIRRLFDVERQRLARQRVQALAATVDDAEWLAPRHESFCQRAGEPIEAGAICPCMFAHDGAVFA